jgi:hypothetical protein
MLLGDEVESNNVSRDKILSKQSLRGTSWSCQFLQTIRYSERYHVSHLGPAVDTPAEAKCWSRPVTTQETSPFDTGCPPWTPCPFESELYRRDKVAIALSACSSQANYLCDPSWFKLTYL